MLWMGSSPFHHCGSWEPFHPTPGHAATSVPRFISLCSKHCVLFQSNGAQNSGRLLQQNPLSAGHVFAMSFFSKLSQDKSLDRNHHFLGDLFLERNSGSLFALILMWWGSIFPLLQMLWLSLQTTSALERSFNISTLEWRRSIAHHSIEEVQVDPKPSWSSSLPVVKEIFFPLCKKRNDTGGPDSHLHFSCSEQKTALGAAFTVWRGCSVNENPALRLTRCCRLIS